MNVSALKSSNPVGRGFRMPTRDQLVATYKGIVERKMKSDTLKTIRTPPTALKALFSAEKELQALKGQMMRAFYSPEAYKKVEAKLHRLEKKVQSESNKLEKKFPAYDITPTGVVGTKRTVYTIDGQLIVRLQPVGPITISTWKNAGPMPLF